MNIGKSIAKLRCDLSLSQEKFADLIGVSRQAVQKWESETSSPDMENLARIANQFGISLDLLVLGRDKREMEELRVVKKIEPQYDMINGWDSYADNLMIEYRQSMDEGKDLAQYEGLFQAVSGMRTVGAPGDFGTSSGEKDPNGCDSCQFGGSDSRRMGRKNLRLSAW